MKRLFLPRVASRIFGEPLCIDPKKLDVIITAVGPRLYGMPFDDDDDDDNDNTDSGYQVINSGIAVISISGTLVAKASGMDAMSGMTSYSSIADNLQSALADPNVSGIVLSIDSPGGECKGMFELADMIYAARGQKPMCAVVACAASAAYLLASAADYVIVSQTGIVGSIGVICLHLDESVADEKAGLKYTSIFAGDRKNDGNPHEPLSQEAKDSMQSRVDQIYGMFTSAVARNRSLDQAAVRKTQAAIYMGQDGVDAGLADAMGSEDDAVSVVARTAMSGSKSIFAASAAISKENTQMENKLPADAKTPTAAEIEAMIAKAKTEGFGDAAQIVDLCMIAGTPDLAAGFITEKKSLADVQGALLKNRADAQSKTLVNTSSMPGADTKTGKEGAGTAEPWGKVLSALGIKRR